MLKMATAALVAGILLAAAPASAGGARLSVPTAWSQYYYGPGYYGPGYYGRGPSGGEVAAGLIGGLAVGAIAAGAANAAAAAEAPTVMDPSMVAYCARKFRSFDPATGTYLGRDGQRRVCQ